MGYPMAKNILKGGFDLIAYNRTLDKAKGLSKDGAKLATSIKEAVENSKIILTMIHGEKDEVVPVSFSKKVIALFPFATKKIVIIKNGDHSLSDKKPLKRIIKELDIIIKNVV